MAGFQGFDEETFDFLWGIRLNNRRDWFQDHKDIYTAHVYQPMKDLAEQVWGAMRKAYPDLDLDCKVARIYRDVRRLYNGGPYKEHLWFVLRQYCEDWSSRPAFYFELSPEGYECGMGYYWVRPATMAAFRRELLERPEEMRALALALDGQKRFRLEGEEYKRPKPGTEQVDAVLRPWFNRKGVAITHFHGPDKAVTSPGLAARLVKDFKWLMPYYTYFLRLDAALAEGER